MFKYYLFILGCQFNYYDAEKLAQSLDRIGGNETTKPDNADVAVIFACSVRQKAADRILGHIRNWKKKNPKIKTIITACVLPHDRKRLLKGADLIVKEKDLIDNPQNHIVRCNQRTTDIDSSRQARTIKVRRSTNYQLTDYGKTAYVTITAGCNNFCSYCAVPFTRGRETSKPLPFIISEINDLVNSGFKSIMLLGQNVNSYGLSDYKPRNLRKNKSPLGKPWSVKNPSPFVKLLREISKIDGIERISFLSPNPQDMSSDLMGWMKTENKFSRELNLPVQSGSDKILKKMNRRYTRQEYLSLVDTIKKNVPKIYLSTDIIVGFPGETKKDYLDTIDIVNKCKFDKAFISIYSPRPGTTAAMMVDDVSYKEKKRRWNILNNIIN